MLKRWALIVLVAVTHALPTRAEPDAAVRIVARSELQADVDVLQRAYEQLHPGLLRYNTSAQMQAHFDALRQSLDRDQPVAEAYLALSRFTATIQCGHTYPNFYNQTKGLQAALFERGASRVPFQFRWLASRMVVTRDLTQQAVLPRGTEILAIDGITTADILASMLKIARADGGNDDKRVALLEVTGNDRYETFDVYLPLLFPQIGNEQLLTVLRPSDAGPDQLAVKGLTHAQRTASRIERAESDDAGWTFDTSARDLAVLRMPGWALYDSKWDWKGFLRTTFEQLNVKQTPALVIDLRGNEGGLDVGMEILPHLIDQPLTIPTPATRVRYRKVPSDLEPFLDTWDPSFKDWGDAVQLHDARFFNLTRWSDSSGSITVEPRSPRFAGKVFVLVGAANSSATFQFASLMQQTGLGRLVGQGTGGNQRGINGGAFFFLRLPNSNIELDLPLIATFPAGAPPDAGLTPDIAVVPTIEDIATGRDAELEAVRAALLPHR